jgi:HPr kinase/phosphorylase
MLLHATCVALQNKAVLLMGPAGAGKSDLALRLIDGGAQLVADDQTELSMEGQALMASAPASIAGLMEVRNIGLMKLPFMHSAEVALCVDLALATEKLERLPDKDTIFLLDQAVPRLRLHAFEASSLAKIRAFLLYPLATDL